MLCDREKTCKINLECPFFRPLRGAHVADKLTIELDAMLDDHITFEMHCFETSLAGRRLRFLTTIFMLIITETLLIGFAVVCWYSVTPVNSISSAVVSSMLAFLSIVFAVQCPQIVRNSHRQRVKQYYASDGGTAFVGRRTITISSEGFSEEGEQARFFYTWGGIKGVERTPDCIYLYVSSHRANCVPRRAFASDEAFDAFANACEQYQRAERPAPSNSAEHGIKRPRKGDIKACMSPFPPRS
jgi:hypothetical protein